MRQYRVMGMSCAACSTRVEKAVCAVPGVTACSVSLLTNSMGVEGTASPEEVIRAVQQAGYSADLKGDASARSIAAGEEALQDHETPLLQKRLLASLGFWLVLMYVSMGNMMWGWPLPAFLEENPVAMGLAQLLLCAVVMVINQRFFISGVKALLRGAPNMDTLVALGAGVSFLWSIYALFAMTGAQMCGNMTGVMAYMHELYFESAATILTLITVGKMLEARSKGKTTDAIKSLMRLTPKTAVVVRDGREETVPVEQVGIGDIFAVYPGESIPVDGVVEEGSSAVDESALTGESIPVDKEAGDAVSAATINRSGYLRCRATRVGEDTTVSQIIQTVSDAAATKAPISKMADRVSGVFVPIVMTVAVITATIWMLCGKGMAFALARGISVLVISCPCALGLATPVAVMVGNGKGAKNGILFKTAASLEEAGRVQIAALDKTGTITVGRPQVTDLIPADNHTEMELLSAAYALERRSEHPLAKAILLYAQEKAMPPQEITAFEIFPGNGLSAMLDGKRLLGGSMQFVGGLVNLPAALAKQAERLAEQGKTPLLFAADTDLLGIIAVADAMKQESPGAIRELQGMGIQVVMLTGDNPKTANAIGDAAGVDAVIAGVLPQEKETAIQKLMEHGRVVMVGDGINDAPALTRANIGMAIGAGTDIAIEAADIVLMKSRLSDVPAAIRLGRATLRNIRENLFWAFFYNVIGIPLAAGVWIPVFGWKLNPMFGAAAMCLSSFCVVSNALRLNWFNIRSSRHDRRKKAADIAKALQSIPAKADQKEWVIMKTMKIEGMMCGHCEATVKTALESIDGVTEARVSHETGTAQITLRQEVPDEVLRRAVEAKDYKVISIT